MSLRATQDTSLSAFGRLQHVLGARQRVVYAALLTKSMTDKQIGDHLAWPINEVTPRRGELVKMGLVKKAEVIKQDGRSAILWEIQTSNENSEG